MKTFKKIMKLLVSLALIACIAVASFTVGMNFGDGNDEKPNLPEANEGTTNARPINTLIMAGTNLSLSILNSDGTSTAVNKDDSVFGDVVWTPGHKETVTLTIANNGEETVRYSLGVNSGSETPATNAEGKEVKLSALLQFGFADSLSENAEATTLKALNSGYGMIGSLEKGCSQTLVLVVSLPDTAENIFAEADIDLGITFLASQPMNGEGGGESLSGVAGFTASSNLEGAVENGALSAPVEIGSTDSAMSAVVPTGVKLEDGASQLTLSVSNVDSSNANITLGKTDAQVSLDVHVAGVAEDNAVPMEIVIRGVAAPGLNSTSIKLYHVEDGETVEMNYLAATETFSAHNQFKYDPMTGDITIYIASFSEVAVVADTENPWGGKYDFSWFTPNQKNYTIANADQLAAFGAIVGGMPIGKDANGDYVYAYTAEEEGVTYHQYTFNGETVTLVANVNIGTVSEGEHIFYPIGYWNSTGSYEKQSGVSVSSSVYSFEGTFDGHGHTIKNFYHNTWEMFGDYNSSYGGTPNHYDDAMGLFGYVYGATIKNLTVKNFSCDGEFTPAGVIAAYACNATFENISIVDCNPRVYNTGNGGIIGIAGNSSDTNEYGITLSNITVDNSNKISALWGSWDVACGGLVGMFRGSGTIHFDNCHAAAQIDVYNDVCANYQYYAYRYSGMMIGSVRKNATIGGRVYPDMTGISFEDCTVHFGDWNDYYYCELVANTTASYTHDHQMSRLEQVLSVDVENKTVTYLDGTEAAIPSGRRNYVVVTNKNADGTWKHGDGHDNATCYHFVDGEVWNHEDAGYHNGENGEKYIDENGDGVADLKEDKQIVYREFNNLVTGYGWGVTSKGINDVAGVTILDHAPESIIKFRVNTAAIGSYQSGTTILLPELFQVANNITIPVKYENLLITASPIGDSNVSVSYEINAADWTKSTITFTGNGSAFVTISDYYFCHAVTTVINVREGDIERIEGVVEEDIYISSDDVNKNYNNDRLNTHRSQYRPVIRYDLSYIMNYLGFEHKKDNGKLEFTFTFTEGKVPNDLTTLSVYAFSNAQNGKCNVYNTDITQLKWNNCKADGSYDRFYRYNASFFISDGQVQTRAPEDGNGTYGITSELIKGENGSYLTVTIDYSDIAKYICTDIGENYGALLMGFDFGASSIQFASTESANPPTVTFVADHSGDTYINKFTDVSAAQYHTGSTVNITKLFTGTGNISAENIVVTYVRDEEAIGDPNNFQYHDGGIIFTPNYEDWTKSTITFTGNGKIKVFISDYSLCNVTEAAFEVLYDANKRNGFDSDKEYELLLQYGQWGVDTNGSSITETGAPEGAIGNMDSDGKYITYTFWLDQPGIVDLTWRVAGVKYNAGSNSNDGLVTAGGMSDVMNVRLDGRYVNIYGIKLDAGAGNQLWWNICDITIQDIMLDAGMHTFRCEIKNGVNAGVNIASMIVNSTSKVGVKGVAYHDNSDNIVTDGDKTYYEIKVTSTEFLEESDIVFKDAGTGTIYPVASINTPNYQDGYIIIDITEAAKATNNFATFDPEISFLGGDPIVLVPNYLKLEATDIYEREGKVYYGLTYRLFGYNPESLVFFDKADFETNKIKKDGFLVTYEVDLTEQHELEFWPHLKVNGANWDSASNTSSDNGDVHLPIGFEAETLKVGGYTYMLYSAYNMPVAFAFEGDTYLKITKAELLNQNGTVYYGLTYHIVGYDAASDIEFFNGNDKYNAIYEKQDGYYALYKINITGEHGKEVYPHLRVKGNNWNSATNTASANGEVTYPDTDTSITVGDYTYRLCNIDWDSDSNSTITASLTVKTDTSYIRVVGAHLNVSSGKVDYCLIFSTYNYPRPYSRTMNIYDTGKEHYASKDSGFQVRFRVDVTDQGQFWPHIKYNDAQVPDISNTNCDVLYDTEIHQTVTSGNYTYYLDCDSSTYWMPRVVRS